MKIYSESRKKLNLRVKEMFNIPVEDAIGAVKLYIVSEKLFRGPEMKVEIVEATRKRAVVRWFKCAWDERFNELEVEPELRGGCHIHEPINNEALKAINPKLIYKLTKSLARGDPYCEAVIEFKDV